jgi:hypothetical protein
VPVIRFIIPLYVCWTVGIELNQWIEVPNGYVIMSQTFPRRQRARDSVFPVSDLRNAG